MAKSSSVLSITVTQQALNLLRQIVTAQGWAKTITDIYQGGKLLVETLPQLDSLSWVKTSEELSKLTKAEKEAYLAKDQQWGEKPQSFTVTTLERDTIERAFQHFAATAASAKQLGPNVYLLELIESFKIKDPCNESAEAE